MNEGEIKALAREIARETVQEMRADADMKCSFCHSLDGIANHAKSHEAFDEFMATMNRINKIKWGVLQAIAIAGVFAILALIGLRLK